MSARVKFLEAFSEACALLALPFPDCDYLFREISRLGDDSLQSWIEGIDESTYPLFEWIESLVYFQKWLLEQGKTKNFADQIEYIHCCTQGNANTGKLLPLVDVLKDYIETYGVVG